MKAKIRRTGEIVDVICYGGSPLNRSDVLDYVNYIDSQGIEHTEPNHLNYFWDFEPIEMANNEHLQDVRERAAIAAMQTLICKKYDASNGYLFSTSIAFDAVEYANALIEQLKKN